MDRLRAALALGGSTTRAVLRNRARLDYRQLFRGTSVRRPRGAVDANLSLSADATAEAPAIETALEREWPGARPRRPVLWEPIRRGSPGSLQERLTPVTPLRAGGGDPRPVTEGDGHRHLFYLSVDPHPRLLPAPHRRPPATGAPGRWPGSGDRPRWQSWCGRLWVITCNGPATRTGGDRRPGPAPRGSVSARGAERPQESDRLARLDRRRRHRPPRPRCCSRRRGDRQHLRSEHPLRVGSRLTCPSRAVGHLRGDGHTGRSTGRATLPAGRGRRIPGPTARSCSGTRCRA